MRKINLGISVAVYACISCMPAISGASSATISFPLPSSIRAGEKITTPLKVNVSNGDLGGMAVDLIYDPAAVSITADSDIAGANGNFVCAANAHNAISTLNTSSLACATGYFGITGPITMANVTITGVGKKRGTTSIKIVPRSFVSSLGVVSALPQPEAFSPMPSAINRQIYVQNRW